MCFTVQLSMFIAVSDSFDILSCCFLFVKDFFQLFSKLFSVLNDFPDATLTSYHCFLCLSTVFSFFLVFSFFSFFCHTWITVQTTTIPCHTVSGKFRRLLCGLLSCLLVFLVGFTDSFSDFPPAFSGIAFFIIRGRIYEYGEKNPYHGNKRFCWE